MKTFSLLILIGFLTISCSTNDADDQLKIDPKNEISFQVELINSNENFISKAKNLTLKHKSAYRSKQLDDKMNIGRSSSFELELENGKVMEFSINYYKPGVNKDLLILDKENSEFYGKKWDYKSFENETTDFYQKLEAIGIDIDYKYLNINSSKANFSFLSSEKVLVNGEEKSYITIRFEGDAIGSYDPDGQTGVYKITNGTFKGVIE